MQSVCVEVEPPTPQLPSSSTTTLSAENREKKLTSPLCWCKRENPVSAVSISRRQKEQMSVDAERAAHTGMEEQSRASHKYLLLQVWCGLLTVSMVTMGAFLTTLKPNSEEVGVKMGSISPKDMNIFEHLKSQETLSFIEVTLNLDNSWEASLKSEPSTLYVNQDSIYSKRKSHYFVYAQVTFTNGASSNRSVILKRNGTAGKMLRVLAEARGSAGSSVWMGKIIKLAENDSISLNISGTFKKENTFWGVYQLH